MIIGGPAPGREGGPVSGSMTGATGSPGTGPTGSAGPAGGAPFRGRVIEGRVTD